MAGSAGYTEETKGGQGDQPQTAPGKMTTTTPRQGPPRGHQGAHPRSHNCARHSHVPQQTRCPIRRGQSYGPTRRTCHGEMRPGRHGVAGTGPQNPGSPPQPNPRPHQDGTPIPHHVGQEVPISHKGEVQVHVHHPLGVEGRLAAYELLGPTWQLNVINVHVPFGDATETFLEHLMEAYQQLAMNGPTVIIGDFNAAPSADDCGGRQTPEDTAVQVAMQHLGLQDLTASLRGQPSHRPPQPCLADSRIDLCYADSAHVEVARTQHHDVPSHITGHRPLEIQIKVLQVPPASRDDMDHDEQPPIRPPEEQDTHK